MALTIGSRLGAHEILAALGAGGMGEVYRAHDTKLNRQVAIKILPAEYANDPDRVARFQREAQAVAALNHPGIAAIYDFAQADGVSYLVLELVDGDTLADRLRRGPVPVDEALGITKQICEALEAAHEKGICHRDLKPANIKLTAEGAIKVLDFGLAKVLQDTGASRVNLTNSPTLSLAGTLPGVILGTAGYMSPEQAKGFPADQRSDIFSLGCILYELLTGRQAFEGETASEILASVLKSEPDLTRLPPRLNPRIADVLGRCLAKQPKQRWHAVADLRVEIESILGQGAFAQPTRADTRPWWRRALPVTAGVIAGVALAGATAWYLRPAPDRRVSRFTVMLPPGQQLTIPSRPLLAMSRDGGQFVYTTTEGLYLRQLTELEPRLISGTETVRPIGPVFSPDGRHLAFYAPADRTLKRIAVAGGVAVTICAVDVASGIHWSDDGIVFGQPGKGILRVAEVGGKPELLVAESGGETLAAPQMLPGGGAVLYSAANGTGINRWDTGRIVVQKLDSGERTTLIEGGTEGRYVPSGHLAYALGGTLLAVPFDLDRLVVTGPAAPVVQGVRRAVVATSATVQPAHFSFSDNGTLVYVPGPLSTSNTRSDLAIIDRNGQVQPLKVPPAPYDSPRVSPDGRWIAVGSNDGRDAAIWVYEVSGTSALRRLTFGGKNKYPLWSADSQWVAFQSDREGDLGIFRQRVTGGAVERLTKAEAGVEHVPQAWSPKGSPLLFSVAASGSFRLWALTLADRKADAWGGIQSTNLIEASFSPDGQWVTYQSGEALSESDIYVQPFPDAGAKYMLPRDQQNHHPLWSPTGKEIFYIPRQGTTAVIGVTTAPQVAFGAAVQIPRGGRVEGPPSAHRNHDVFPDGKRFVGVIPEGTEQTPAAYATQVRIVLNWFEDLKQRAPP